jgi:hypothetical protein
MVGVTALATIDPPSVPVPSNDDAPVTIIRSEDLMMLGQKLDSLFRQYISDRRIAELRWLANERQYLGIYDPDIENELSKNRSKAYPRITRVKCISVLSRLMNLMFPGNERNWEIKASPGSDMTVKDVKEAIATQQKKDQDANVPIEMDLDYVMSAIQTLADQRAEEISTLIDDQLQELGGDQTLDYIALNRSVLKSGILYGLGVLRGPYARAVKSSTWSLDAQGQPQVRSKTIYKPVFEFLKIWDFYPDMSAKTLQDMDGYFTRVVMSRSQVRALAEREDFFATQVKKYLRNNPIGNYRPQPYETELRTLGVKVNVNEQKSETSKYEVIVWHGMVSGEFLRLAGIEVSDDKLADDLDAEVWLIDSNVIKCTLNPWEMLDVKVKTIHTFLFDEDDTSPVGFGLPNSIRDSQMAISAATRMLLDNASVVCGPNLEINMDLMVGNQDLTSVSAYKIWYREGMGAEAAQPAVKNVIIESHMEDLLKVIDLFMKFADAETFVGPATGGDLDKSPSEPLRTAAGASMLRGDAALPFKDIVRSFDGFTQSVLESLVQFNKKFNPDKAPSGDYDVVARGATSLIAKEVRGMQIDQLVQTLTDEEKTHVDMRKLAKARFAVRDMADLLVSDEEAARRQKQQDQAAADAQAQQKSMMEAEVRKTLADAFKNIAQGQKNAAATDATNVNTALSVLEQGTQGGQPAGPGMPPPAGAPNGGDQGSGGEDGGGSIPPQGQSGAVPDGGGLGLPAPDDQGQAGGMPPGAVPAPPGAGPGL